MTTPSSSTVPSVIASRPFRQRSSVDFPQPEGPTTAITSPGGDLQVDSVQGPEVPVVLPQTGDSQHWGHVVAHFLSRRRAPQEIGKHTTKYMISTVP